MDEVQSMPLPLTYHNAEVLDNHIYYIGGCSVSLRSGPVPPDTMIRLSSQTATTLMSVMGNDGNRFHEKQSDEMSELLYPPMTHR